MADGTCSGFEAQSYLRDRCKKCFRLKANHELEAASSSGSKLPTSAASSGKAHRPGPAAPTNAPKTTLSVVVATPTKSAPEKRSAKDATNNRKCNGTEINTVAMTTTGESDVNTATATTTPQVIPNIKHGGDTARERRRSSCKETTASSATSNERLELNGSGGIGSSDDSISLASYRTANSKSIRTRSGDQMFSARSDESVNSTMDSTSMVTALSDGSFLDFKLANSLEDRHHHRLNSNDSDAYDDDERAMTPTDALSEFFVDRDMQVQCWRENVRLRSENESLAADIAELRQEMEEMHDQYREEEIEEFRELQRELEQNAKNCRILQFKLRKAERERDHLQTEKNVIGCKLRELRSSQQPPNPQAQPSAATTTIPFPATGAPAAARLSAAKELESELRIAKEVSVRLHNELELAEEKRYKLEDDVFFYKEKARELQTQHKWREARSRAENKRQEEKVNTSDAQERAPLSDADRELRDVLEREGDLKEQLRFTEDNLRRTQTRLRAVENENEEIAQKLADINNNSFNNISNTSLTTKLPSLASTRGRHRPPMLRSYRDANEASKLLLTRVEELEMRNAELLERLKGQNGAAKNEIDALEKHSVDVSEASPAGKNMQAGNGVVASSDEVEECCLLLASIEAQADRISKQLGKLDPETQKRERRRSLTSRDSITTSALIDLANVAKELRAIKSRFAPPKPCAGASASADGDNNNRSEVVGHLGVYVKEGGSGGRSEDCVECKELHAKIDLHAEEQAFYRKKNKELTKQVLETEDRWTAEIERQSQEYKKRLDEITSQLSQMKEELRAQLELTSQRQSLAEENQMQLESAEQRIRAIGVELAESRKQMHEIEAEQKTRREWQIKHQKLESLYTKEREKFNAERSKIKEDSALLKKRTDEAVVELNNLRDGHQRREIMWNEEREKLEKEIAGLKEATRAIPSTSGGEMAGSDAATIVPIRTINYRVTRMSSELTGLPELKQKISTLERRNEQLEDEVLSLRMMNDRREAEFQKNEQVWRQERDVLSHKNRQEEKIRGAEFESLQQKFQSRIGIMENTNKSLHAQLLQVRRERDFHKETIASLEQKLLQTRKDADTEVGKQSQQVNSAKESEKRIAALKAAHDHIASELALTKDAHQADRKLWASERAHLARLHSVVPVASANKEDGSNNGDVAENSDRRITEEALGAAENVQKKYAEYQKFYSAEVSRLNSKMKEMGREMASKEHKFREKAKELTERIKILEIESRNLVQAKENQMNAKEAMQADHERLVQAIQQLKVQKLSRNYKLSAILDRLKLTTYGSKQPASGGAPNNTHQQIDVVMKRTIGELNSLLKEEASSHAQLCAKLPLPSGDVLSHSSISLRSNPGSYAGSGVWMDRGDKCGRAFTQISATNRSYSTESSTTWDSRLLDGTARSVSPLKRHHCDRVFGAAAGECDTTGLFFPNMIARSASYDRYGEVEKSAVSGEDDRAPLRVVRTMADVGSRSLYCGEPEAVSEMGLLEYRRTNSAGTNILYKIRRDELAKGQPPSVKAIAKAFESMGKPTDNGPNANAVRSTKVWSRATGGLFSMRKSRSVDQENGPLLLEGGGVPRRAGAQIPPRGGRNPFRGMGTKLVDAVRRSLSRSMSRGRKRKEGEADESLRCSEADAPPIPFIEDGGSVQSTLTSAEPTQATTRNKPS